ncbi:uncharacterized protein LOC132558337 [Ylistrum balloti]|uniref:uncharacterized protein LOC132558337 n=1 Tax=Ylistrum balloti TaxID=509963 RepID=UPI002905DE75|nr:uncharacterized protein LOC132558337 [Ylistrum balloti]
MSSTENIIPEADVFQKMTLAETSSLYFKYMNTLQVFCPVKKVYGGVREGWYTCDTIRGSNSKQCAAYMITDKNVTKSFFEELKQDYNCGRNVITKRCSLSTAQASPIPEKNSDVAALKAKSDVDFMAIDIGGGEAQLLDWMLTQNLLRNVHQLLVNFHGITANSRKSDYVEHLKVLRALFKEGFRTFHFARNINGNCLFKNRRKTGCYSLYMMRQMPVKSPIVVDDLETIKTRSLRDLAVVYNSLLMSSQAHCKEVVRIGDVDDGGWDVCNGSEYRPLSPCIVYSFGIAGDWSFDDEISRIYGCEVHSFDPSIGKVDHQRSNKISFHNLGLWGKPKGKLRKWNMMNLKEIIEMLGHTEKTIDIVKMDIEGSEWQAIPNMLATGVLKNVRQLFFEFHSDPNPNEKLRSKVTTLRGINDQGFQLFWSHPNIVKTNVKKFSVTGRQVSTCYENYYLNTNFRRNN